MIESTQALDVVAVLDAAGNQLFADVQGMKATVMPSAKIPEHPLENGASIADHVIILPTTIELSAMLSAEAYRDVYQQVRAAFLRADVFTVQTRVGSWASMALEKIPHEESPEVQGGILLVLGFREVRFVVARFSEFKVAADKPGSQNTKPRGQQQPKEAPPARKASILSGIFK